MAFLKTCKSAVFMCAFLGAYSLSVDVSAQSSRDVDNRLLRLENELNTLSRAIYRGEAPTPSLRSGSIGGASGADSAVNANAEIRIQELEAQIRDLTGKLEEQNFKMRQLEQKFERTTSDMALRLDDMKAGGSAGGVSDGTMTYTPQSSSPSASAAVPKDGGMQYRPAIKKIEPDVIPSSGVTTENVGDETALNKPRVERLGTLPARPANPIAGDADGATLDYENAFSLLKSGDYTQAETAFKAFLSNHNGHALSSNAQYWLGETYYVRGDYQQSARVFAEGFQKYPQSSKAPDSLLKLGMSLAGMGNASDACVALAKLKADFATVNSPVVRRADVEMAKLSCQ